MFRCTRTHMHENMWVFLGLSLGCAGGQQMESTNTQQMTCFPVSPNNASPTSYFWNVLQQSHAVTSFVAKE